MYIFDILIFPFELRLWRRIFGQDILNTLQLAVVSGARFDVPVNACANADIRRDSRCALSVYGGMAIVDSLRNFGPRSLYIQLYAIRSHSPSESFRRCTDLSWCRNRCNCRI